MIKRGFIDEQLTSLNEYTSSFNFGTTETECKALAHVPLKFVALEKPCYDVPFIIEQSLLKDLK